MKESKQKKSIRERFNEHLTIRFHGKRLCLFAACVAAVMVIFVTANRKLFLAEPEYGTALFVFALLSAALAFIFIATKWEYTPKGRVRVCTFLFFLMPIVSMQMVECFNGKFVYNFSVQTFILNYLVYLFFYLLIYFITGRYHFAGLMMNIFLFVFGVVNYFVDLFRGTPFIPMDIITFKTGAEVASGYEYSLSWNLIMAAITLFLAYLLNKKILNVKPEKKKHRLFARFLALVYMVIMLLVFFGSDTLAEHGYKPDFWDQSRGYHNTGSWLNFCLNLKYLHVSKPDDYDAAKVEEMLYTYLKDYGVNPDTDVSTNILTGENDYIPTSEHPNVICIMNESLADLASLGDLQTNEDAMPFMHKLEKNTVKGTLEMPVFGAGTSNSEFEFLSGDAISFLPAGCNVYQSYIKGEQTSLVSSMKALGYSATAYHPYYGAGWNREDVYPALGFDDYISIEDFINNDTLETYKDNNDVLEYERLVKEQYPDEKILLRRFVSDAYDYKMIKDMYENRDTSQPFFLFNVTMQNHGGYAIPYANFDQRIYTSNLSKSYEKANRYLSLVKESDDAFKDLVAYFQKVKEPTIICMFGDHQPSLENEFYSELHGQDVDSLEGEELQKHFATPFIIWANYDIPEAEVGQISANYLSTYVSQLAGLPQTLYQKYLAVLRQEIPVIDTAGYVGNDGICHTYDDETKYSETLRQYQCIEYNNLIDKEGFVSKLFTLEDKKKG